MQVWDIRYPGRWLARLAGRMGAIRAARFSPCGAYLATAEPADFVHLYSTASGFTQQQVRGAEGRGRCAWPMCMHAAAQRPLAACQTAAWPADAFLAHCFPFTASPKASSSPPGGSEGQRVRGSEGQRVRVSAKLATYD